MRVLVCGGRQYNNRSHVFNTLDEIHGITEIIQGGAKGADRLAQQWALEKGIPCRTFEADWDRYGKAAGMIRNQRMINEGKPDLVISFPGKRGTADMVAKAKMAGIEVVEVK
jgi:hypothetical protein